MLEEAAVAVNEGRGRAPGLHQVPSTPLLRLRREHTPPGKLLEGSPLTCCGYPASKALIYPHVPWHVPSPLLTVPRGLPSSPGLMQWRGRGPGLLCGQGLPCGYLASP